MWHVFMPALKKKVEQTAHSMEKIYHNKAEMAVAVNIYSCQTEQKSQLE